MSARKLRSVSWQTAQTFITNSLARIRLRGSGTADEYTILCAHYENCQHQRAELFGWVFTEPEFVYNYIMVNNTEATEKLFIIVSCETKQKL